MARNMRYDLFHNYQMKFEKIPWGKQLDVEESKKLFCLSKIDEDIKVL